MLQDPGHGPEELSKRLVVSPHDESFGAIAGSLMARAALLVEPSDVAACRVRNGAPASQLLKESVGTPVAQDLK
jgi:hypothetical protein